jgi:iron complex transport system substrate-binding protein
MKNLFLFVLIMVIGGCRRDTVSVMQKNETIPRLVALSPSLSEAVFALGVGGQLVGVTAFADYPPEVKDLPKIGGYSEINVEAVFALNPSLVLALNQQENTVKRLRSLGIQTATFSNDTLEDIIAMLQEMGNLLKRQERAQELINEIEDTKKTLAGITADLPPRKVLVSVGRNMGTGAIGDVYVAGSNTIYGQVIELVGGTSAFEGSMPYAALGREAIMRLNPDVILDLIPNLDQMPNYSEKDAIEQWAGFDTLDAVIHSNIVICTANYICVPGPRVAMMMRDLAKAIHPSIDLTQ